MKEKDMLSLVMLAGEIMLSNGAETYRVEDTMRRMLLAENFTIAESFVTTTGIFASIDCEATGVITMVKRVKIRTIHLEKVALVNDLSRKFVAKKITEEDAIEILRKIEKLPPHSLKTRTIFSGVSCFCFCYLFKGNLYDCSAAFIIGLLLCQVTNFFYMRKVANFLIHIIGGVFIAVVALLLLQIKEVTNIDLIIIGSIMPLVPGLALTNAVRDILEGDFMSGTNRIVDAIIIAISVATGVGVVLKFWLFIFGGFLL